MPDRDEVPAVSLLAVLRSAEWRRYFLTHSLILLAALVAFRAVAALGHRAGLSLGSWEQAASDPQLYFDWSSAVFAGRVPYREFDVPYPPLAFLLFLLPRAFAWSLKPYLVAYGLQMLLLNGLVLALILRERSSKQSMRWYLAMIAPQALMVIWRMDVAVALVCFWGCTEWIRGRERAGALLLGLGAMLKLLPAAVFGALELASLRSRRAATIRAAAIFAAVCVTIGAAWLAIGGMRWLPAAKYTERNFEFGSTYAGLLLLWAKISGSAAMVAPENSCNCMEVAGSGAAASVFKTGALVLPAAAFLAFGILALVRKRVDPFRWCAAALVIFMISAKALSPQYLIWPVPFFCVLSGVGADRVRSVYLAACVLTAMIFPPGYHYLVAQNLLLVLLLNLRNALLVVCTIQLFQVAARSTSRAYGSVKKRGDTAAAR